MTVGSWSVTLDTHNWASRSWSGSDTAKQFKVDIRGRRVRVYPDKFSVEHNYESLVKKYRSQGYMVWSWTGSSWVANGRQYVTAQNPCLSQTRMDALYDQISYSSQLEAMKAKMADQILGTEFNAGVQMGTAHETIKSVVSLSKGVLKAARAVKDGQPGNAVRYLIKGISGAMAAEPNLRALNSRRGRVRSQLIAHEKRIADHLKITTLDVSQTWLSLRYGWVPMVKDIHEGLQLIDEGLNNEAVRFSARNRRKVTLPRTRVSTYQDAGPVWSHRDLGIRVTLKRRPSTFESLGLHDPASVAWELLPFSFVVDWFVPVGDFLRSRSVAPLLDPACWISHLRFYAAKETKYNPWISGIDPWADHQGNRGTNTQDGIWDERVIGFSRYADTWVKRPPVKSISKALSLGHLANGAALIHQLIANFRK